MKDRLFPDPLSAAFGTDWRLLSVIFLLMIVVGVLAFLNGLSGEDVQRTWQVYLINFLFWTGLAYGALLFAAILNMTNAGWGRPLKRLAEAASAFLPFSFILFFVLYLGRDQIFPWIHDPVPGKEWWLNVHSLFIRNGLGLFVLMSVALALVYFSIKGDTGAPGFSSGHLDISSTQNARNVGSRGWQAQQVLSPVFGILYAVVISIIAIDLIMSLEPHWVSTLFPAYFFMSSFYLALAALMLLLVFSRNTEGLHGYLKPSHMHDLGKLMLAFCLVSGDFFYSQFLVIWFGNLPEETRFVILRVNQSPWRVLAWTVLFACFAMPFIILLSRRVKMKPRFMAALSCVILVGMWFERLLLVAPSLWKGKSIPVGLTEIAITAGFLGIMALCLMLFFHLFPLIPAGDPLFREQVELMRNNEEK